MGYAHGIKWNDELTKKEIINIMNALNISRMPTRNEIITVTGSNALPSRISRTKGYYGWAKKLNLPIKDSETTFGKECEYFVKQILENKGFKVEKMAQNYPYDLLINGNIRIDVKTAKPYINKKDNSKYFTFNLYKKYSVCDIYFIICINEQNKVEKILLIPSNKLKITQLSIGKNSRYDIYKDNYDILKKYDDFYSNVV